MAKRSSKDGSVNGEKVSRESGKVADIYSAAKSLVVPEDYSKGYGEIMHGVRINRGASKSARRGGAD